MQTIHWECPECLEDNHDPIDPIDGPFVTCICGQCGKAFEQDKVVDTVSDDEQAA